MIKIKKAKYLSYLSEALGASNCKKERDNEGERQGRNKGRNDEIRLVSFPDTRKNKETDMV